MAKQVYELDEATEDGLRKLLWDIENGETLDERGLEPEEVAGVRALFQELVNRQ